MPEPPESIPLETPLHIAGVGNGTQSCHYKLKTAVALTDADGRTEAHTLTVPIVEGSGANLPGLLGLKSLEAQNAILDTGRRMLHFPGPDTRPLQLPEGTISIPLEKAPSGHLCMVVGDFHKLTSTANGLVDPDSSLQLHANEAQSSSSSTSAPRKENEWNQFQAYYKDSGLSKEMVNELYWDHKQMTKPDNRKLSETQRREEYQRLKSEDAFKENQRRLAAARAKAKTSMRKEPNPEPEATSGGAAGVRRLDLHCHI